ESPAGATADHYRGRRSAGRRTLNAPIKYASLFYRSIAPGERYCRKCGNFDASLVLSPPF
ncbi:MAG: hypothetical protein IJW17_08915, partial [Lentisphaeria bacterium]|nr:hypothetical protein [Lentisphaeria bacterium]